ncbi:MAG TPA: sugar phosphate isomerase/epimerase family protein, partial [Caldilineaceae bacterium]|nr:sugar phosphate isomerase/epimerase family protein [Caldilineaceae bacterium]
MQVGISHLVASDLPLAEFLPQAAQAGYEVVEVCMRRQGDLTPQSQPEQLAQIVALAEANQLKLVSMTHGHCTGNLLDAGEAQQTSIRETETGLRAAAAMGIGCTLHTLGVLRPDLYYDDAYRNGVHSLRRIAETAEKLKVTLAIEFVWNGFLFSPLEMKHFLDEVGSPYIGFYFDPGNMAVFQYPHHWVRIVGPHLKMVHLKDWQGRALNGGWPALLAGEVDYVAMNRELR